MRNSQIFLITHLFFFAQVFAQQTTIKHINQLNEQRIVDLSSSFGVATSLFSVNSSGDSQAPTTTQPFITSLDKTDPTSTMYVYASSQIQLSNTLTSSAQITIDQSAVNAQQSLTLYTLDSSNPSVKITQIATLNIQAQFGFQEIKNYVEVSLSEQNQGIVLLTDTTNSYYFLFSFDGNTIKVSSLLSLVGSYQYLQAYKGPLNTIQFIITLINKQASNMVQLYSIQSDASNLKLVTTVAACGKTNAIESAVINTLVYGLKCILQPNPSTYNYSLYRINPVTNSLETLTSEKFRDYQYPNYQSIRVINNSIFVAEYFAQIDSIQLIKIIPNFSDNSVSISLSSMLANSDLQVNGVFITNDHLVTLSSASNIYGYSINNQNKVLQFPFSAASLGYQQTQNVLQIGNNLLFRLLIVETMNFSSLQIITNIPTLQYIQSSNTAQSYTVTMQNDVLNRQLQIVTSLATLNQYSIQITSSDQFTYTPMLLSAGQTNNSIDNYFSGSNLSPTVGQVSPQFAGTFTPSIQITQQFTPNDDYLQSSPITNIFGIGQDYILTDEYYEDKQSRYANLYQIQSSTSNSIQFISSIKIQQPITNVDASGFFLTTSTDSFWVVNGYLKQADSFQSITTTCKSTSTIQFSSLPKQNTVAVVCDALLSLYTYNYQSTEPQFSFIQNSIDISSVPLGGNVLVISLRSSGLLYIASSTKILCVNINGSIVSGFITIPQSQQTNQIYLFDSSFFLASNTGGILSIIQLSYNNFNSGEASFLRSLMSFDYTWKITNTFSGIAQVINPSTSQGSVEFLVVDAVNTQSQLPFKMYYKVSRISSENQFYTVVPYQNGEFFFTLPTYFGYFSTTSQKMQYYTLSSTINLSLDIQLDQTNLQIASTYTLPITVKGNNSFNYVFSLQRNIGPNQGVINQDNQNVQKLSNYFKNNELKVGATVQFNDSGSFSSNYYGWGVNALNNDINLSATIAQKISTSQTSAQTYVDILEVMPNAFIYMANYNTYLQSQQIGNSFSGVCTLFRDDSQTKISSQTGQSTVQVTIYQSCYSNVLDLTQYQIKGVYTNFPSTVPEVSLTQPTSYSITTDLLTNQNLIRIITDPLLNQTLAILKSNISNVSSICQLNLSQNPVTLDCNAQSSINNLQIVNVYWLSASNLVVYLSNNGNAYYNFNKTNQKAITVPIKSSLIAQHKNVQQNSFITIMKDLGSNGIMITFDNQSIFIISLEMNATSKTLILSPNILVFYTNESDFIFTGNIYYSSTQSQVVLVFQQAYQSIVYSFYVYEKFQMTSDYLATSSSDSTVTANLTSKDIRFFTQNNNLQALFRSSNGYYPIIIALQQYVGITVDKFNSNLDINGVGSYLTPIGGQQSIGLMFSQQGTVIKSNSNILSFSIISIVVLIFVCILC